MRRVLTLAVVILGMAGPLGCSCGNGGSGNLNGDSGTPDGGDAGSSVVTSLALSPQNVSLDIQDTTPAHQDFTLTATFDDGHQGDVSNLAQWWVTDTSLGGFISNHFTSGTQKGGSTQVAAKYQGITVSTGLTLVKHQSFTQDGPDGGTDLPPDPSAPFNGPADAARAPQVVYPNDGVLLPPNLGRLEFHFLPGSGSNTLFRLRFSNSVTAVDVYMRCTAPDSSRRVLSSSACVYMPDPSVWSAIAETNRGGEPVTVSVQGTDDTGTGVGSSGTIQISFANDDLHGGLYYWTTSSGTAIMRYDFASSSQTTAQRFLDGTATGTSCVGCHALSHDGAKLVAEVQGQSDGRTILWDVADGGAVVPFPSPAKSIFESWNPDGSAYAAVGAELGTGFYPLRIIDGNTGAVASTINSTGDSSHPADHPDWSPLGDKIVYVKIGDMTASGGPGSSGGTSQRMHAGAIELISKLSDGGWSAPAELVPEVAGKNHYYPAFDPEGQFIVYDESTCLGAGDGTDISCNADTDPTATLFALPLDGGSAIELANANKPGPLDRLSDGGVQNELTDSFPKWSPFVTQRTTDPSSKVMWVTFSSSRRFGAYAPPAGNGEAMLGTETFVWMAAIDPAKLASGQDPSFPAFVLPFQDFTTSNHIAQWAQQVLGGQCVTEGNTCDPNGSVGAGTACCEGLTCAPPQQGEIVDVCQVILN